MDWYYKTGDGKAGPINDREVRELAEQGKITGETMVWNERESKWRYFREVADQAAEEPISKDPASEDEFRAEIHWQPYTNPDISGDDNDDAHLEMAAAVAASESYCSGCFKKFPNDKLVRRGKEKFCPTCELLQSKEKSKDKKEKKLPSLPVAGLLPRSAAKIIDYMIIGIIDMLIYATAFLFMLWTDAIFISTARVLILLSVYILWILSYIGYAVFFVGQYGATPGKLAFRIKVVNEDGTDAGYAKALYRCLAEIPGAVILAAGYIMAAFDVERRTLHDRICRTRVISTTARS